VLLQAAFTAARHPHQHSSSSLSSRWISSRQRMLMTIRIQRKVSISTNSGFLLDVGICICCTTFSVAFTSPRERAQTHATHTPMAASHFRGPSALPPLANTLPADEAGLARAEGMSGFADAADAFLLRLDAWTVCSAGSLVHAKYKTYHKLKFR